jgi:ABC-2 type transport system permease protein
MPEIFQWATLLNPVRHYIEIVRAVFLKGAGFSELSRQFGALFLIGTSVLVFATRRFRKNG